MRAPKLPRLTTVVAILTALALPSGATAAVPADFYGINAGPVLFSLQPGDVAANLTAIAATGVGQVRYDAAWQVAEPSAPRNGVRSYHWDADDAVAGQLARAGLRWYALVDYGTRWAGRVPLDAFSPPRHPEDFAAYAVAFIARYGQGGAFWAQHPELAARPVTSVELWNEPNAIGFWHPAPDARVYATLVATAADAINRVDPAVRVVIGGLDNTGASPIDAAHFLAAMVAARPDLRGKVDAVGVHQYNDALDATYGRIGELRGVVDQTLGPDIPIDVTEVGWATGGSLPLFFSPPVSEATRAGLYSGLIDTLSRSDCGIGAVIPYAWQTAEGRSPSQNDFFGIADHTGHLKASGAAFARQIAGFRGGAPPPVGVLDICHRPGAVGPDVPAAAPLLRAKLRSRSQCRRGRALIRLRGGPGVIKARLRVDDRKTRTVVLGAGNVLDVRLRLGARRATAIGITSDGSHTPAAAVRVAGHCRRG